MAIVSDKGKSKSLYEIFLGEIDITWNYHSKGQHRAWHPRVNIRMIVSDLQLRNWFYDWAKDLSVTSTGKVKFYE